MVNTAVIIVNWNGKKYLKDCFDSLERQTYKDFKIVFVDNGSEDGSVDFIKNRYLGSKFPSIEIIQLEKNTGFCFGYNMGIKKALEDKNINYVIILNNDTKLDEKYIEEIINCAKNHPEAGSIQPKVLNFFEPDKIDCAGILLSIDGVAVNRGYGEKDQGQLESEEEIFGANGTASLLFREALEKIQIKEGEYFDNDYFAYYEDVDLAWRMRLAGFKSFFCPRAKLFHIHSATANKIFGSKAYYLNRNRFFTLIKNYPLCRLIVILLFFTPIRYLFLLFRIIMKKGRKSAEFFGQSKKIAAKEILRGGKDVISNISNLTKKRRLIQENKRVNGQEIANWFRKYGIKWSKTF